MGIQLDGGTVSVIVLAVATLLSYVVSQTTAKSREDRRRLRRLARRDIAFVRWRHNVEVWAAERGYDDLPDIPRILLESEDDGD